MADLMSPGSPLWWLRKLGKQLDDRKKELQRYDDYYEGKHPLAFATVKFQTAFGDLFKEFSDNWCELVVDAVDERLTVEGFRMGKDQVGSRKAWSYWQQNYLDAESKLAHNAALVQEKAYGLVWADEEDQSPEITIESPTQVVVAMECGSRRERAAALKRWTDDSGYVQATIYLPDAVYKYQSRRPTTGFGGQYYAGEAQAWVPREVPGEPWPLPNPLGVVPVVPLVNRPRLLKDGVSEIKRIIPLQDAVNKMVSDMLVASEFGAAPQRWATGLEVPIDPVTKKPVAVFEHMIDRLWTNKKAEGRFGQFAQTDLTIFVRAVEMIVQHIASQTRTPPHYFALNGQFPSGESIKSAETGLVAKARQKMLHFGEGWEEIIRLAFLVDGDTKRAQYAGMETIWADPESRTEAEHVDATIKKKALDVPRLQLWEDVGYSPQQIEKFQAMIAAEPPAEQVPVIPTETIRA